MNVSLVGDFQGLKELIIEDYNNPNDKFLLINPDMLSLGFGFGESRTVN